MSRIAFFAVVGTALIPSAAMSQTASTVGIYGTPGLIEMPTAEVTPDAELTTTFSQFADADNIAVGFQFLPQLMVSYRIQRLENFGARGTAYDGIWDLHFQLFDETDITPAVAVGLRDFFATGRTVSQYVVATKTFADQLKVTGGIGWGRLSDSDDLQADYSKSGGDFRWDEYFTGETGFFGGIEWATPIDGVTFKAEYSSDQYVQENEIFLPRSFDRESDYNFGVEYTTPLNFTLGAYYMYGSEYAFMLSTALNPKRGRPQGYVVPAPLPIQPRDQAARSDLSWLSTPDVETVAANALRSTLSKDGISVRKIKLTGRQVDIIVTSSRLQPAAQTYGRVARALTYVMPESVETFVIGVQNGAFETAQMVINRSDLERLELSPNGVRESATTFSIEDIPYPTDGFTEFPRDFPRFNWGVRPFLNVTLFSSGNRPAVRAGLAASASVSFSENLRIGAGARLPVIDGNTDNDNTRGPDESAYFTDFEVTLTRLSADYFQKLGDNIYSKANVGLFSSQWGGVGGEILYKRADQRWGIGLDVNHVWQRDTEEYFEFVDYDVTTGHVSFYYSGRGGFDYEVNAGRYLEGDWGSTFTVNRTFDNGWSVGVFATATDISGAEFGDGRFQKGFTIDIPFGWAIGTQTRRTVGDRIASTSGNGGARLRTPGNLFGTVDQFHADNVSGTWGAFWK